MTKRPKFNKGDKVRCIDNLGCNTHLTVGEVYTYVGTKSGGYVMVEETKDNGWSDFRFELYKPNVYLPEDLFTL